MAEFSEHTNTSEIAHDTSLEGADAIVVTPLGSDEASLLQAAPDAQPFRLFDLPQELQDSVFEYAYPEQFGLRLITKLAWDATQR
jgi:hypothetical protein